MGVGIYDNKGMNALLRYIAEHPDRTDQEWADLFGISRPHFNMIRNGKAQPSKTVMQRMEDVTDGAVPILSWFHDHRGAA